MNVTRIGTVRHGAGARRRRCRRSAGGDRPHGLDAFLISLQLRVDDAPPVAPGDAADAAELVDGIAVGRELAGAAQHEGRAARIARGHQLEIGAVGDGHARFDADIEIEPVALIAGDVGDHEEGAVDRLHDRRLQVARLDVGADNGGHAGHQLDQPSDVAAATRRLGGEFGGVEDGSGAGRARSTRPIAGDGAVDLGREGGAVRRLSEPATRRHRRRA